MPLAAGLSLVPVVVFLLGLRAFDTYRLLSLRRIVSAIAIGCAAAALAYPINVVAFARFGASYAIWGAPVTEEILKAAYPVWCIRRSRIGFPVDAAILGFAVGAGFALTENLVYLRELPAGTILLWIIRGCSTAMMHGSTTAIVAIVAVTAVDLRGPAALAAVPGLLPALAIHVFHNSGILSPALMAQVILVLSPVLLVAVFAKSERMLAAWLNSKLDQDAELLSMIDSGHFLDSAPGRYLQSLHDIFPPLVVGDMLCLIHLSVEISAQAKGYLLRRKCGLPPYIDPALPDMLNEISYVERNIGLAGRRALAPLLPVQSRDRWEVFRLSHNE